MPAMPLARALILLIVLILPAAALLLLGPRGQRDMPADRVVVRYWEKWAGVEAASIRAIVQDFNQTEGKERGIWVDLHAVSNIDERMLIATAGGDPPDLAGLYDRYVAQFAAQGALLDLTELAPQAGIDVQAFKPIWRDVGSLDGRLYGLPCAPSTIALFYNKRLFRAAGLNPERPPATTDEFNDAMLRLTRVDDTGAIVQLGFTAWPAMLGWWPWAWPGFFDERLWDGQRFRLDTPAGRAAYEWLAAPRTELGVERLLRFETSNLPIEGPDNPFLSEKLAMVLQGPWMTTWIQTYKPELDYGVARFPSSRSERRNVLVSADVLVIPRTARRPREALIFLEYLMRPAVMEQLALAHSKLSPYQAPSESFFLQHRNPHIRFFDELATSPDAFGNPRMPIFAEAWTELRDLIYCVLRGSQPLAEAVAATQRRVDEKLAHFEANARRRKALAAPRARHARRACARRHPSRRV